MDRDFQTVRAIVAALVMRTDAETDPRRAHNASEALKQADALMAAMGEEEDRLARTISANRQLVDQLHDAHQNNATLMAKVAELEERLAHTEVHGTES